MQTAEQLEPMGVISHLTTDYKVAFMCDKMLYNNATQYKICKCS